MGNSLADQLLKAGLGDKQQAKKAQHQQRKKARQQNKPKKSAKPVVNAITLAQQQRDAEKITHDRMLNLAIKAKNEKKAIQAQIKQLVELNKIEVNNPEVRYSFTDNNIVQDILITEALKHLISTGRVAIVRLADQYTLVVLAVAEKIKQRDNDCIVVLNTKEIGIENENDLYADFKVPDDLTW